MAKAGILTFHRGANYGGFLQARSLRDAVRSLGHDAEIINYKNPVHEAHERYRLRPGRNLRSVWANHRKHMMWRRMYGDLVTGEPVSDPAKIDWARYDVVVVGSDVVWDYQTPKFGSDPVYFGGVPGPGPGRWVSYAASCGRASGHDLSAEKVAGLREFQCIGVRDRTTAELVRRHTGRKAELVIDPTWLSEEQPGPAADKTEPILAVYGYAVVERGLVEAIRAFARERGLSIVSYGFPHRWADRNVLDLSPSEWIEAIRAARCVVTGTFHGTLYAIRLRKAFCTVGNGWISNKIRAPLELVERPSRMVFDGASLTRQLASQLEEGPADLYTKVRGERMKSTQYLEKALAADAGDVVKCLKPA